MHQSPRDGRQLAGVARPSRRTAPRAIAGPDGVRDERHTVQDFDKQCLDGHLVLDGGPVAMLAMLAMLAILSLLAMLAMLATLADTCDAWDA